MFSQNDIIELWDEIPNHIKTNEKEIVSKTDIIRIKNVIKPTNNVIKKIKIINKFFLINSTIV